MATTNALPKEQATARDIPSVAWAYVRMIAGTSQNAEWCVSSETGSACIRLGTAADCDWRIGGPAVQPIHVELIWDGAVLWAIDLARRGDVAAAGELVTGPTPLRGLVCLAFGGAALLIETSQLDLLEGPLPSRTVRRQPPEGSASGRPTVPAKAVAGEAAEAARQLGLTVRARPGAAGGTGPARDFGRTVRAKPGPRSQAGARRRVTPAPTDPQVTEAFAALASMDPKPTLPSVGPQPTLVTGLSRDEVLAEVAAPRPRLGLAARPAETPSVRRDESASVEPAATRPPSPVKVPNWKKRAHVLRPAPPPPEPMAGAEDATEDQSTAAPEASPWRSEPPAVGPTKPPTTRRALLLAALVPATLWLALSAGGAATEAAAPRPAAASAPLTAPAAAEEEPTPAPEPGTEPAPTSEELAGEPGAAAAQDVDEAVDEAVDGRAAERGDRPAGTGPTDERMAIDLVVAGRYAEAVARYEVLAQENPDRPDLAVVARILRRKIAESCKGGTPCTP